VLVSPDDERIIRDCLRAAVDGPFFPEWEFQTLIGLERDEVRGVLAKWPGTSDVEGQTLAVNNVLHTLLGYPHHASGETWHAYIDASPRGVADVYSRWRSGDSLDPSGKGYFDRLM
jgi:hypothetical protein